MKAVTVIGILVQLLAIGCRTHGLKATGTGADLAPFRSMRLPAGTHPTMLSIADINKDGNPDVLVANGGSGNVSVYLGDGKGGFSQASGSPFPAGQNCADIATGDLNGDGNLDIAIANHGVKFVTVL